MKRLEILLALLLCSAFGLWAQDNNTSQNTTDRDAQGQTERDAHKAAAQSDANAADQKKQDAKDASSSQGAERDKVLSRLDDSSKVLNELLATPDKGIPEKVFESARCVAVVPSMVRGGFVFGAEHGRGVATCRTAHGWSAPAFFVITGGSWGAQIGGEAVDLVMLIMNDNGMNDLLSAKFKLGGTGSVAAGPVGRDASANTDWKLKSEVLTYSRTRGLFAGLTLNGAMIKQDDDATRAFYSRLVGFRPTLTGEVPAPHEADRFLATVRRGKAESISQAR
jgi:SH3 domain-containing YSC84-like protein 1